MTASDQRLTHLIERVLPAARIVKTVALGPDVGADGKTTKSTGYGQPIRIDVEQGGRTRRLVLHTATSNAFGHDRRADRAAEMLLAYDTFGSIPGHVEALDIGAFDEHGGTVSLVDTGEFYVLTTWAAGEIYAEQLRRVAARGNAESGELKCVERLAHTLAELHAEKHTSAAAYERSVRDLVGSGEGIFGIVDSYPADAPGAPRQRVQAIERRCVEWRWRLREHNQRLARIHGDFHPFNIVVGDGGKIQLLDASRGCRGDPADDLTALAINFVFFALETPGSWARGFGRLWERFFAAYLEQSGDRGVLSVAPPFLAWRGLVVADPAWYPDVGGKIRDALLSFVERTLDAGFLDPASANEIFE